jgi:hypothetical protein
MPITHKRAKALTLTLVLVPTLVIACTGITDNGDIFVVMNQMEARRRSIRSGQKSFQAQEC